MKVSELSRLAGTAPSAVRWYEAGGVVAPAGRPGGRAGRPGGDRRTRERPGAPAGRAARKELAVTPIRVLFVCTHNSARSQIAEALLRRYGGADFEVHSAGTEATRVNPYAI